MSKRYIAPCMEFVDVEVEGLLALSVSDKQADPEEKVLSNSRRGEWGDLWSAE